MVDDLVLLGVRAGANHEALKYLDIADKKRGTFTKRPLSLLFFNYGNHNISLQFKYLLSQFCVGSVPPCAAEEMFLCRLLQVDSIGTSNCDEVVRKVEEGLALRHSSTVELMGVFENNIASQRAKAESISQNLLAVKSAEGLFVGVSIISLFCFRSHCSTENSQTLLFSRCHCSVVQH